MSEYYKNILLFQRVGTRGGIVCRMTMTYLYIMYFLCNRWGKKNFCREMYVNFTVIHPKKNTFGNHDVKFKVR